MRMLLPFALAWVACAQTGPGRIQLAKDLYLDPVAEGAWVVRHEWMYASNSAVLRMPDGHVVMVDTPCTPKATERLLSWIRAQLKPAGLVAINTHYHVDRLGGNAALRKAGIVSWGTTHTAQLVKERGRAESPDPRNPLVPPEQLFDENSPLKLQGLEIFYPGPGHTPDNIVVWEPARRILIGGCLVAGMPKLGYMREADPSSWVAAIEKLEALRPAIVISGHGDRTDPEQLENTRALLRNYRR